MKETKNVVKYHCYGCGAELQNTAPTETGYIPRANLTGNDLLLCQRCYRLQHYGVEKEGVTYSVEFKNILAQAKKSKSLIVYVVDLFAFESSLVSEIHDLIRDNQILIIANKRDVLPREINDDKFKNFVHARFLEAGLDVKDIIIASAYKNYNIDELIAYIENYKLGKDVYVVGASSVGKSSIINSFLKVYKNETKNVISTSPYPGTTLDVIKIPLNNRSYIYDTPGILVEKSIYSHIENKILKYVVPRREIKPRTFQINDNQSIFIGGIARLDYIKGHRTGVTFYVSNEVELHRTKLERADQIFDSVVANHKIKPVSLMVEGSESLESHSFDLPFQMVDITINGLCWIRIKGKGQKFRVLAPRGVDVMVRECKI